MRNSIKKMVLTAVAVTMMVAGLAAPAMAEEQQPPQQQTVAPAPAVAAPNDDPVPRDPGNPQTTAAPAEEATSDEAPANEEPLKDPGIRQCDITPTACPDADAPLAEHGDNPGADTDADDPSPVEEDEEPLKDPGIRQCDITPTACPDAEDSLDDQGHTSDADPDANEANPVEEESKEAVSAPDEAGQIANSDPDIQGGCPFDGYEYDEDLETCVPSDGDFIGVVNGDKPLPDTAGGWVALPGHAVAETMVGGLGTAAGLIGNGIEDALVWYGEGGGPIGWGFQGLGYTIGFAGDVTGTILQGAGAIIGGVSDAVGDAVDAVGDAAGAVGDAAEDVWDGITGGWW